MNIEKTKCYDCDRELQPFEGKVYSQSKWFGKYYAGTDYFDLCKPCYKKWRKEDDRKLKKLGIIVLIFISAVVIATIVSIKLSN